MEHRFSDFAFVAGVLGQIKLLSEGGRQDAKVAERCFFMIDNLEP